jgi:hypothetical protein
MNDSFELFLRNSQQIWIFCPDCGVIIDADNADEHKKCKIDRRNIIEIKDLGEWAWRRIADWHKSELASYSSVELGQELFEIRCIHMNSLVYQIACACLGKNEVNKRLKKLKGKT